MRRLRIILCLDVWLLSAQSMFPGNCQAATEYYFSNLGNDQVGNGSQSNPWRTITKFNSLDLEPGDKAFFRAGDIFNGSMVLDQDDSGVDVRGNLIVPITIGSYGGTSDERSIIRSAATSAALIAENSAGIELSHLEFRNGGTFASNSASGIEFRLNSSLTSTGSHLEHLRLDNVISHGFRRSGLSLGSTVNVGYKDVQVTNSQFHGNQFAGIEISASQWTDLIHEDVRVDSVLAYNNMGYNNCSPHCGHGIVMGQVDGAVIENSRAYSNGVVAGKGNVGIWAWQSNGVVIQKNQAYGNRSPLGGDGGGYDLDGGVTNSVVQYNMSSDNDGAGYLLAQFAFAESMQQNTFRFNVSINDGIDDYGAITVWGEDSFSVASSALFHNNTVIVDKNTAPNSRGPVSFLNGNHSDIDFLNNVFVALNGADLVDGPVSLQRAQFVNNAYWTDDAPIRVGETVYESISTWADATQQEMLNGELAGVEADPLFTPDNDFGLLNASPLVNAGLPSDSSAWPSWWTGLGSSDFYGTTVPQGPTVDIGAVEYWDLAGDFNLDGVVDAADYVIWRKFVQELSQYATWRTNYGRSIHSMGSGSGNVSVPEPQSMTLLAVLISLFIHGELRRRSPSTSRIVSQG